MTDQEKRWLAIGKAVERATDELPEDYELLIELESGAGSVRLCFPHTEITEDTWDNHDFAEKINGAIDYAIDDARARAD